MVWWSLPLTIVVFIIARYLAKKFNFPLLNPLVISVALIIPILLIGQIPYAHYFQGSKILNDLLQPAVVALAFPLYQQLPQIQRYWRALLLLCMLGSLAAIVSGTAIALWLGASPEIAASLLPKSVTTPIAMAISQVLDGQPAISAICVLLAGLTGAMFGHLILRLVRVHTTIAKGLAIGASSHALGTARCLEFSYQEGAYSSLALVICGVATSLIAPFVFPLLLTLFYVG